MASDGVTLHRWEDMANKIQTGEQQANDKFYGLVFQGNSYEGLTCDALEWYQSAGAGGFIDNGKVTINNPRGVRILDQFSAQIGKVTPRDVTTYQEGEAHTAFVEGNAAFMAPSSPGSEGPACAVPVGSDSDGAGSRNASTMSAPTATPVASASRT